MSGSEQPGTQIVDVDLTVEETAKSPEFAKLIEEAKALPNGSDTGALGLMAKAAMMHLSDIQVDVLLRAISKSTGIGLRALRAGWKKIIERAEREEWEANANARARAKAEEEARREREKEELRKRLWVSCSKIAMSATLLADMEAVAHKLGVVNEGAGIRAVYLTSTSRLLLDDAARLFRLGAPASGKNLVAERVLRLIPEGAVVQVSGSSPKVLAYYGGQDPDALKHKIIYIPEAQIIAAKHEVENEFAIMLRTLISEGRVVYQTVVARNGVPAEAVTMVKNGPIAAIITTARNVDPELRTRVLMMDTDESGAQTVAIVESILSKPKAKPDLEPWLALQMWLEVDAPYRIDIPFREAIFQAFEHGRPGFIGKAALRMRRDVSSFLTAVEASAVLHKVQRESAEDGAIVATIDDYANAHGAFDGELAAVYGEASEKVIATVEAIEAMQGAAGFSVKVTLRELARRLRVASHVTANARLAAALDYGAIEQDDAMSGRGGARYYKVLKSSREIRKLPGLGVFPPPEQVANIIWGDGGRKTATQTEQKEKGPKKKWL